MIHYDIIKVTHGRLVTYIKKIITIAKASKLLNVSEKTIYRKIHNNNISYIKIFSSYRLFLDDVLEEKF